MSSFVTFKGRSFKSLNLKLESFKPVMVMEQENQEIFIDKK